MSTEKESTVEFTEKEIARRMLVLRTVGESKIGILAEVEMRIGMVQSPDREFWKSLWRGVDFWDVVQGMVEDHLLAVSGQTLVKGSRKTLLEQFIGLFQRKDNSLDSFLIVLHKTACGMEFIADIEESAISAYVDIKEKIMRCENIRSQ